MKERRIAEASILLQANPNLRAEIENRFRNQGDSPMDEDIPIGSGPYLIEGGRICVKKNTEDGCIAIPLCNFMAWVEQEIVLDDGAETVRMFVLTGTLENGQILPEARVPAAKFGGMAWVAEQWGVAA